MTPGKLFTEKRGSLAYCSPTILEGKPYTGIPEDIWSLGIWSVSSFSLFQLFDCLFVLCQLCNFFE
jgi:serine/threonine protein kinase